jgi:ElaB/YqjD/DUF883 family membrane-anchored ribosome-binding protein
MVSWGKAERKTGRLSQALDSIRGHLKELSHDFSRTTHHQLGRARAFASETAHDAEDTMHDHLAASMLVALGLGVLVGYLIRRGTE